MLLRGSFLSKVIKNELKNKISKQIKKPGLGIILVGDKPDSKIYVRMKKKACEFVGIKNFDIHLPSDATESTILEKVEEFNQDDRVHGILIQLPLPKHLNEQKILNKVRLDKDVDGFHLENIGKLSVNSKDNLLVPCTPHGILELLDRNGLGDLSGKNVVVVGRSKIVGVPVSMLMLHRNATVTVCHSRTVDLMDHVRKADVLIVAVGRANFIDDVKEGAVVIDVGINRVDDDSAKKGYRIVGDVDFDKVKDKTKAITPVPGGVGPMTIAMLLSHTYDAFMNINKE